MNQELKTDLDSLRNFVQDNDTTYNEEFCFIIDEIILYFTLQEKK